MIARPITFHQRVALTDAAGGHIRYLPGAAARALVEQDAAEYNPTGGRVRAIALRYAARTHAERIGEPTGRATGVRFYRWERLEQSASRIVQHHPRCLY